jgi:hypothetical protein
MFEIIYDDNPDSIDDEIYEKIYGLNANIKSIQRELFKIVGDEQKQDDLGAKQVHILVQLRKKKNVCHFFWFFVFCFLFFVFEEIKNNSCSNTNKTLFYFSQVCTYFCVKN